MGGSEGGWPGQDQWLAVKVQTIAGTVQQALFSVWLS